MLGFEDIGKICWETNTIMKKLVWKVAIAGSFLLGFEALQSSANGLN